MGAIHRPANRADASGLYEIRQRSILELSPPKMSIAEAQAWAARLTPAGMERKLLEFEVWVAECDDRLVGWGAIRADVLEGLYTAPEFAGRGVGGGLLARLEGLMRERGTDALRAEASPNALEFYLRRGYRQTGPLTPDGAWPITKQLR